MGDTPWHTVSADDVESELQTSDGGLSRSEVEKRREKYGPNEIEEDDATPAAQLLLRQFKSPLIYILLVALVVTLVVGEYLDSGVIAAVVALNAIIGFTQERRAENAVRELNELVSPQAHVVRDGEEQQVGSAELVPGDVVLLESGEQVAADIRLSSTTNLSTDESLLTGESVAVEKSSEAVEEDARVAEQSSMAFKGSVVTRGRGRGYVVATGEQTELGSIAESMREEERVETPLQERMERFARIIAVVTGIVAAVAFGVGVVMGRGMVEMFMIAVALAVAAVPEGLPVVLTVTLAVGVRRMADRNAIIRHLPAVETLGSTTVIGADKTGTLTQNQMTVERIWTTAGNDVRLRRDERQEEEESAEEEEGVEEQESTEGAQASEEDPAPKEHEDVVEQGEVDDELFERALLAAVLANEGEFRRKDGEVETSGDPTEVALLRVAARLGMEPEEVRARYDSIAEVPFESEQKFSASVRAEDDRQVVYVKGAPEQVLSMSSSMASADGATDLDRETIEEKAAEMAEDGLRVLALAYRFDERREVSDEDVDTSDLCFLGLVGMMDPPREEVHEAIKACQSAGMRVVMITGDHAATALAIAHTLGLLESKDAPAITGDELEDLSDEELRERVQEVSVYARVAPEQKLRVVRVLQELGETVAVTGDGVNDGPALNAAEIGIAMGESGTDVARAASDMVLTDDNFVSIKDAAEEGRITFDNIRKVTFFLISSGAAEILTILSALAFGWSIPFVAAQLLWLNLVTNGLQDVALAFEPGEEGVLERPPRDTEEGVVSKLLWVRTGLVGVVMAAGTLAMFQWELSQGGSLEQARTVAMTTMVFFQIFHVMNARSDHQSVFKRNLFSNKFLFIATSVALVVHIAALYLPFTQYVLRIEPITDPISWLLMVGVAASVIVVVELHKFAHRRRSGGREAPRESHDHAAQPSPAE